MQYLLGHNMPLVPVKIGISGPAKAYFDQQLDPYPPDLEVTALIDTGATVTVIDQTIVHRLRLLQRGECTVRGFDSQMHASEHSRRYPNYDVSLTILAAQGEPQPVVICPAVQVIGTDIGHDRFQILLGLDVLRHCTLFMHLADGHFDVSPVTPYPVGG
jgi:hypothetical protein